LFRRIEPITMAGAELRNGFESTIDRETKSPKLDWIQGDIGMLLASYVGSKNWRKRRKNGACTG